MIQMLILAVGLSMDSLVIALTSGAVIGNHKLINILKIAGMLAFMQMSLTVFGWFLGSTFAQYIDRYDHWFAFGILCFLGIRVVIASFKEEETPFNPLDFKVMFSLAVATSIDATAVGLSLSLVNIQIIHPMIVIGLITFLLSAFGIIFGCKVGQRYNFRFSLAGGIILILIGCSILFQHTLLEGSSLAFL